MLHSARSTCRGLAFTHTCCKYLLYRCKFNPRAPELLSLNTKLRLNVCCPCKKPAHQTCRLRRLSSIFKHAVTNRPVYPVNSRLSDCDRHAGTVHYLHGEQSKAVMHGATETIEVFFCTAGSLFLLHHSRMTSRFQFCFFSKYALVFFSSWSALLTG